MKKERKKKTKPQQTNQNPNHTIPTQKKKTTKKLIIQRKRTCLQELQTSTVTQQAETLSFTVMSFP